MDTDLRPTTRKERDILTLQNASIVLFANNLAKRMGIAKLTPPQLDELIALPVGTTALFLKGDDLPQKKTVEAYAVALGCTTSSLWTDFTERYDEDVVYPSG